ncbi:MAG: hypothetical protein ACLVKO_10195 [Dysgonomonas sp.]
MLTVSITKVPYSFFIEAFAQSIIGGRTGIYIFQIINMFLVLVMIYKTIDLFKISLSVKIFCIVSFLLVLRLIFGEGNQTEEYSLLCSCISLYITLKYFLLPSSNLSSLRIFILGLCLSVVFWTRPNNAGIIVGCILFLFILTLKEKNIRLAAKYICFIFIGFLSLSFIICSYFYYKGTLGDMLYSSFIFNFIYSKVGRASGLRILQIIFYNLVVFVPLLGGILSYQKKNKDKNSILLLVCLFVCGFCFSNFGFKQFYYIAALTPLVPVGFAFLERQCFILFTKKTRLY